VGALGARLANTHAHTQEHKNTRTPIHPHPHSRKPLTRTRSTLAHPPSGPGATQRSMAQPSLPPEPRNVTSTEKSVCKWLKSRDRCTSSSAADCGALDFCWDRFGSRGRLAVEVTVPVRRLRTQDGQGRGEALVCGSTGQRMWDKGGDE
jgi:hypothetical protein